MRTPAASAAAHGRGARGVEVADEDVDGEAERCRVLEAGVGGDHEGAGGERADGAVGRRPPLTTRPPLLHDQ